MYYIVSVVTVVLLRVTVIIRACSFFVQIIDDNE